VWLQDRGPNSAGHLLLVVLLDARPGHRERQHVRLSLNLIAELFIKGPNM
jgi:hypothetical protein